MTSMLQAILSAALAGRGIDASEYGDPLPLTPDAVVEQERHEAVVDRLMAEHKAHVQRMNELMGQEQREWRAAMQRLLPNIDDKDVLISLELKQYRVKKPQQPESAQPLEWVREMLAAPEGGAS